MNNTAYYATAFKNFLQNRLTEYDVKALKELSENSASNVASGEFLKVFNEKIYNENLFRRHATIISATKSHGMIFTSNSNVNADFVEEAQAYPQDNDEFDSAEYSSYKLALLTEINNSLLYDISFDIFNHLAWNFSKRFGNAEEKSFITGDGKGRPYGMLKSAETGVKTESSSVITYDDVIKLFLSVKPEYRKNGVWLMNDETMLQIRTLKDSNGNYLWNGNMDNLLGKPVEISGHMPSIGSGNTPIAFGDLSYYWVIIRQPITVKILTQLFATRNHTGYAAYERLDGDLINTEAVKTIQMASEE